MADANLRQDAANAAAGQSMDWFMASYRKDGPHTYETFASRAELDDAYGHLANTPEVFDYVAAFDKNDPAWPAAWAEFGEAIRTIPVMAPAPHVVTHETTKHDLGPVKAVAAIGTALGLGILAARHGRRVARRAARVSRGRR